MLHREGKKTKTQKNRPVPLIPADYRKERACACSHSNEFQLTPKLRRCSWRLRLFLLTGLMCYSDIQVKWRQLGDKPSCCWYQTTPSTSKGITLQHPPPSIQKRPNCSRHLYVCMCVCFPLFSNPVVYVFNLKHRVFTKLICKPK